MNKSLTIALPLHNGEARLRRSVEELLDLASDLTSEFSLLIVDDGSTDDTYEIASELAVRYPQVAVCRHRTQKGLGPAIETIRRRASSDVVIVHDGSSPIDAEQVRRLWRKSLASAKRATDVELQSWQDELAGLTATHTALAAAHDRVAGFGLLHPARRDEAHTCAASTPAPRAPRELLPVSGRGDVGQIPRLPRPNFLSALADFAWGE